MEFVEEIKEPITGLIEKQIEMGKVVGGDLGVLAYCQAIQNMNLLTQDLMRKSIGNTSNVSSVTAEEIKGIVKTVVSEIMKELGAKVE